MFRRVSCAPETWEIQFDFKGRTAEELSPRERRAFMSLSPSLDAGNAWLAALAADADRSAGTGLEYSKVLLYTLEWLAQEPMRLSTSEHVGRSLLTLGPPDLRALHAWLALPAKREIDRHHLVTTGRLPPGYRNHILSRSTRVLRKAAINSFLHWLSTDYFRLEDISEDTREPSPHFANQSHTYFGTVPSPPYRRPSLQLLADEDEFSLSSGQVVTGPVALSVAELRLVLDALPEISHGRNAANRNGALVRTMLWGMLRNSEVTGVSWEMVDGQVLRILGKGRKWRDVPLVEESTWSYLTAYTNELSLPFEQRYHGALFRQLDHEERPITKNTPEDLIKALKAHFRSGAVRAACELDPLEAQPLRNLANKLHTHIFRVTGATFMAAAGMRLITLSLLLGHTDPMTTLRYYVAAKQLNLPEAVKKICQAIMVALEQSSSTETTSSLSDFRSWYERHGLLPLSEGASHVPTTTNA